jgi:hypothetical protein
LAQVRKEYDTVAPLQDIREPLQDIQEQLEGKETPVEWLELATKLSFPERRRLAEAFIDTCSFRNKETPHRIGVVEDMISLYSRQCLVLRPRQRRPSPYRTPDIGDEKAETEESATQGDTHEQLPSLLCQPTQFLECISNSTLPVEERYKSYKSRDSLRRHYDR